MEHLGNFNLFTSQFIMGCDLGKYNDLEAKKALHSWLEYKDSDFAMDSYRVKNTQYVAFLHDIDISRFKDCLADLIIIYKNDFPNAEKEDFLNYVFGYSLYYIKQFISRDYRFLGSPDNKSSFDFYCYYHEIDKAYLDYVIPNNKTIEHFKQLYKKFIKIINNIEFEDVALTSSEKSNESSSIETDGFSGLEWATIFYYVLSSQNKDKVSFNKQKFKSFIKKHDVVGSYDYLRNCYYNAEKRINKTNNLPIAIIEKIIPFLEDNYEVAVANADKDINFLSNESTDY